MTPTVRLTLTARELSLLSLGLTFLRIRLSAAVLGDIPDRAFTPSDDHSATRYRDRAIDVEMGELVLKLLFEKLAGIGTSRKTRLTVFELATLAFALRLSPTVVTRKRVPAGHDELARKLEVYRKRAKRAAINQHGKPVYEGASARWKQFLHWMRFNLVHPPKIESRSRRKLWQEQRDGLQQLIRATLADYRYESLTDAEMARFVKLFKEELRRGRHPVTLRELLKSEPSTQFDFVYTVLSKKVDLRPLPGAKGSLAIILSERGDRFRNRSYRRPEHSAGERTTPTPNTSATPAQEPRPSMWGHVNIPAAVSDWLQHEVQPNLWKALWEHYRFRLLNCDSRTPRVRASTFEELIAETKPQIEEADRAFSFGEMNYFSDWLLAWTRFLESNRAILYGLIRAGIGLALDSQSERESSATLARA